jgi:hypothetical protein
MRQHGNDGWNEEAARATVEAIRQRLDKLFGIEPRSETAAL